MKSRLALIIMLIISAIGYTQTGINYKALIKDSNGNVVASQSVDVQFKILQGVAQTNIYSETHTPTTDTNGLVIVTIGEGATSDLFLDIDWAIDDHFLNVQIDIGSGFVDFGTTQFMHVPYAIQAEKATNVKGLEAIDEGNGIGWRLVDRNSNNYEDIGFNAIDFSFVDNPNLGLGATGDYAFSLGYNGTASGEHALAFGNQNYSLNNYAIALGNNNNVSGLNSTAIGAINQVSGDYAFVAGLQNVASEDYTVALGNSTTASGAYSTAMGRFTIASGIYSTAMGRSTIASGDYSVAMGFFTEASETISTAMGSNSEATGDTSTAMGGNTEASGDLSTAMGNGSRASGFSSTAMGASSEASGNYSTSMGDHTNAESAYSTVIGRYNIGGGDPSTLNDFDPLFEIGNGVFGNRNNALTVYKNGYMRLNSSSVGFQVDSQGQYGIYIPSGNQYGGYFEGDDAAIYAESDINTNADIILGGDSGNANDDGIIASDPDHAGSDIYLRSNDAVVIELDNDASSTNSSFQVQESAGTTVFRVFENGNANLAGTLNQNSDRRLKQDIVDIPYGLNEILQLQPKAYHWKKNKQELKSLGLIAQDVQPIVNEIVNTQNDKAKTLGISYIELIPVLIKAIQEQQSIINSQNQEYQKQKEEISFLNKNFKALVSRMEALESNTSN